jgi:hypothetical protein
MWPELTRLALPRTSLQAQEPQPRSFPTMANRSPRVTAPYSKLNVHSSWMRAAFHTLRTSRRGRTLHIFFHAKDPHRAIITEGCSAPYCNDNPHSHRYELTEGALPEMRSIGRAPGQWTVCVSPGGRGRSGSDAERGFVRGTPRARIRKHGIVIRER